MELILSILALAVGPLVFGVARRHPRWLCGLDGFVLVAIGGLSLFHLLPIAVEHAGWSVLVTAFVGVLGPFIFGRNLPHGGQRRVHNAFIVVAVVGLACHTMIDGAALFQGAHNTPAGEVGLGAMVAAVLIHRVPMSMLVWWSLRPRMGRAKAAAALGLLASTTAAGYLVGGAIGFTPALMGHLIALVAGSLVHVVGHDTASEVIPRHCHDAWHATYSAVGGAVAAAGLFLFGHMHRFAPAWGRFESLFVESAPALLVGFTLGGLVEAGFGKAVLDKLAGQTRLTSALRGVVLGTPIPICSCGIETVYKSLAARGIPVAATVGFLMAGPGMTLYSMALSAELLGPTLTIARIAMSAVVAVVVAVGVSYVADDAADHDDAHGLDLGLAGAPDLGERAADSVQKGWVEQIDHVAPWIVVSFAAVALVWPALDAQLGNRVAPWAQIVGLAVVAAPMYLNASAMTALAAALVANGVAAGAALAMLVTSPSLSMANLRLVRRLHGRRAMWLMVGAGLAATIGLGLLLGVAEPSAAVPMSQQTLAADHGWVEYGCAAVLVGLIVLSYGRMGPRGMLVQLLPAGHHHMHDHGHADHHHGPGDHGGPDHGGPDHGHHESE